MEVRHITIEKIADRYTNNFSLGYN